ARELVLERPPDDRRRLLLLGRERLGVDRVELPETAPGEVGADAEAFRAVRVVPLADHRQLAIQRVLVGAGEVLQPVRHLRAGADRVGREAIRPRVKRGRRRRWRRRRRFGGRAAGGGEGGEHADSDRVPGTHAAESSAAGPTKVYTWRFARAVRW